MKSFDDSRSNTMEYEEFLGFVKMLGVDAQAKMRDITTNVYCVLASAPNKRYIPPKVGKVNLVVSMCYEKNEYSTFGITEAQVLRAVDASKSSMIAGMMLSHVVGMGNFRFHEAVLLLNAIALEVGQTAKTLGRLLMNVVSPTDAVLLVNLYAGRDIKKFMLLEEIVGKYLLKVIMGHYDGFYTLNMENLSDQLCMDRLLGVSSDMDKKRKERNLGDTSQHGNGSCFRNEHMITGYGADAVETTNFVVTKEQFVPMPSNVRLEFDFSSGVRPDPNMSTVCNDLTIVGLLDHLGLLQDPLDHGAIEKAAESHAQATLSAVERAVADAEKEKEKKNRSSTFAVRKSSTMHSNHDDIGLGHLNDQTMHQSKRSKWAIKELALLKAANVRSNNGAGRGFWHPEEGRAIACFRFRQERFMRHISERVDQHNKSLLFPKPFPFTGIYEEAGQKRGITASIRNVVNLAMAVTKVASKLLSKFKLKKNKFGLAKPAITPAAAAAAAPEPELVPTRTGKITPNGSRPGSRVNSRPNSASNTPRKMVSTVSGGGTLKKIGSSNSLRNALDHAHNDKLLSARRHSNPRGGVADNDEELDGEPPPEYVDIDADSEWMDMKAMNSLDSAGDSQVTVSSDDVVEGGNVVVTGLDRLSNQVSAGHAHSGPHTPLAEGLVSEVPELLSMADLPPDRFANLNRYKLLDVSNKAAEARVLGNLKKRFPPPKPVRHHHHDHHHHHHHHHDNSHDDPYKDSLDYLKCHPEHKSLHHIARRLGTHGAVEVHTSHYIPRKKSDTSKVVCENDSYVNICLHYFALAKCLKCRHIAVILKLFDEGRREETPDFGSYRVDMLISLYSRIVDIHNMDCVLAILSAAEQACFIQRIGILNVFNPWKCDGTWCLDLSQREDRTVLRALLHLNLAENHKLIHYFRWVADPEKNPNDVLTNRGGSEASAGTNQDPTAAITTTPKAVSRTVSRKSILSRAGSMHDVGDAHTDPAAVIRGLMADWVASADAIPHSGHLTLSLDSGGGHREAVYPNNLTVPSEASMHDLRLTLVDAPLRDSMLALSLVDYDWLEINFGMMATLHKIPTINSFIASVVTQVEGDNANAGNTKNHAEVQFEERSPKDKNNLRTLNTHLFRVIRPKLTLAEREEKAIFNSRGVKIIPPEEMDTAPHHMQLPYRIGWKYCNETHNDA
jgi:hypothetical protein